MIGQVIIGSLVQVMLLGGSARPTALLNIRMSILLRLLILLINLIIIRIFGISTSCLSIRHINITFTGPGMTTGMTTGA